MKVSRTDLLTPANVISAIGLAMVILGCLRLYSLPGVLLVAAGRLLDLFDGHIARRTHTSDLGAAIDATFDKLAVASILLAILLYGLVPWPALAIVSFRNATIAILAIMAKLKGKHIDVTPDGKHAMFVENAGLGLLLLAPHVPSDAAASLLSAAGLFAIGFSLRPGVRAALQYWRQIAD